MLFASIFAKFVNNFLIEPTVPYLYTICLLTVSEIYHTFHAISLYSGVRVIASRILHEICLLIGELAIGDQI